MPGFPEDFCALKLDTFVDRVLGVLGRKFDWNAIPERIPEQNKQS
jgi:hypothetical protein